MTFVGATRPIDRDGLIADEREGHPLQHELGPLLMLRQTRALATCSVCQDRRSFLTASDLQPVVVSVYKGS